MISRLDSYLAQGQSADLAQRLQRLEEAGSDIGLVKALERTIDRHGLVEFRPALGTIVDRLETSVFEIAVFGRDFLRVDLNDGSAWQIPISLENQNVTEEFAGALDIHAAAAGALNAKAKNAASPRKTNATR